MRDFVDRRYIPMWNLKVTFNYSNQLTNAVSLPLGQSDAHEKSPGSVRARGFRSVGRFTQAVFVRFERPIPDTGLR